MVKNGTNIEVWNISPSSKVSEYNGNNSIFGLDWNSDGTKIAFIEHYKGLFVLNVATSTVEGYYTGNTTQKLHAVDWSPNDMMIAFSIENHKTIIMNITAYSIMFET